MFEVVSSEFGPLKLVKITNSKTGESFSFFPDFGASMNQLVLQGKDKVNHDLLYSLSGLEFESMVAEIRKKYVGSKLFPFPNRINKGSYSFLSKKYQLPVNFPQQGHSIHGLLLESNFKIKEILLSEDEGKVTLSYEYDKEHEGYPFKFELEIDYVLSGKGLQCQTRVRNLSNQEIPIGDGWHPYFKPVQRIDNLYLCMPMVDLVEEDDWQIPTGIYQSYTDYSAFRKIGDKQFDTCFKLTDGKPISEVQLWDKDQDLKLTVWMESGEDGYRYLQVYTPPDRQSIAIEPMTCIPDAFNNKTGLIILLPGEGKLFNWGVSLK